MSEAQLSDTPEGIAIIGMAGRFPGARNVDEFWSNLQNGVDSVTFFSDQELEAAGVNPALLREKNYVKAKAIIEDIELFDAAFFDLPPRQAEIMDPQHRIFLECAWEALENAGYDTAQYEGQIGVYAGTSMNSYMLSNLLSNYGAIESLGSFEAMLGNDKDYLATRVSYKLDLKGPGITVQTACSTSLVAIGLACHSLLTYQNDMALAGGVSISVPQRSGYVYQDGGIFSSDGRCRAFDARANGMVDGNGVGIVILKRLADALENGDYIHAVIKGSAINNDGSLKAGYTAPGIEGQAKVIAMAQAMAEVDPATITYIEAHGTGTSLGDPVEIAALTHVFRDSTSKKGFCAIGSVKTNIGHLDAAAGVAGLIKTTLALKHKMLPPSLHFEEPNPHIDFASSPFYVNTRLAPWQTDGTPRRAGVSSFGIGGTNAHIILEEAPEPERLSASRSWHLLVLSARTLSALETATHQLTTYLEHHPAVDIANVACTLQVGRRAFEHRRVLVCCDLEDATQALARLDPRRILTGFYKQQQRPVMFLFPGQGAQYSQMAAELYRHEPLFRTHVDRYCEMFQPHLGLDLRDVLYPRPGQEEVAARQLQRTALTQPALFVIEYALAQLWMAWGVRPQAMLGHSIGEYVAACLAGVFTLEDAVAVVAMRGQLMQQMPPGAMLSINLSEQQLEPFLNAALSLAALNGPSRCVVSGTVEAIDALQIQLTAQGIHSLPLNTSHAFHSAMVDSILGPFIQRLQHISLKEPQIPYISNVTGTWITGEQATNPEYWAAQLRQTVRFGDGLHILLQEPLALLLEVGPGQTLSSLARHHPQRSVEHVVLSSLPDSQEQLLDEMHLLTTLGRLWLAGVQPDWSGLYVHERRQRLPLPTYPFERQRYWFEAGKQTEHSSQAHSRALSSDVDIADCYYVPSWKRSSPPKAHDAGNSASTQVCWLVFLDLYDVGASIVRCLEQEGQDVIAVNIGEQFARDAEGAYRINPFQADDYAALFKALEASGKTPHRIVHLWNVTSDEQTTPESKHIPGQSSLNPGFLSLLLLMQVLDDQIATHGLRITVVSNNMQQVIGDEVLHPEKATVLGPCKAIAQEYPNVSCSSIDIVVPSTKRLQESTLIDQLLIELHGDSLEAIVAYRGNYRWVQTFERVRLDEAIERKTPLRNGGVYLITGGLGGIGLALAEYLARSVRAKLILTGRSSLPDREAWQYWLATHTEQDAVSQKIRKVLALEEMGAEVLLTTADVTHQEQMQATIDSAYERFGNIHGVIHAAGIAGGGLLQLRTPELAESVLAPKVQGTQVLATLFKDVALDFMVLCSSMTSIIGGFGQVDYCAANAFLDAFAQYSSRPGKKVISINWCPWQETGMSAHSIASSSLNTWQEQNPQNGISSAEGISAFRAIVNSALPQVIVSKQDVQTVIVHQNATQVSSFWKELEEISLTQSVHPRPALENVYVAPQNEPEQTIAAIWQNLLGIERIGIHDDFVELGGDSLLAIQLISRLRESLQVELSLRVLFESRTIAELAAVISVSQQERRDAAPALPPLLAVVSSPAERFEPFPLTDVQQAYWIGRGNEFILGNVSTHSYQEIDIFDLDVERFELAWQRLIERHEMLRVIILPDGQQQILQHVPPYQIPVLDLREYHPEQVQTRLDEVRQQMSHQVLPAEQWPLFQVRLSLLEEGRTRVHLSSDALISDAWSRLLLMHDLLRYYQNPQALLAPLTLSFRDYVLTELALQQTSLYQQAWTYWNQRLSSLPPAPMLPLACSPETIKRPHFVRRSAMLNARDWQRLKERAAQSRLTASGVLLAAFADVLTTWSQQAHFTFNLTLFNRLPLHSQVNEIVGDFTSLTLLEVDNRQAGSFEERACRLQQQLWLDLDQRYVSGVRVLRELARLQGGFQHTLMPIVFTSTLGLPDLSQTEEHTGPGLQMQQVYGISQTPQVWLDHQVYEQEGSLCWNWDVVEGLFPAGMLTAMFETYEQHLQQLAHEEDIWHHCGIGLLPQEQARQRLAINATQTSLPAGLLHEPFVRQFIQCPEQIAVVTTARTLNYQELYERARQVGHWLQLRGACPNQLVGIVMEKGWEQVVAALGVLFSGAAYLPLDPTWSPGRLRQILEQAEVRLALTQSWLEDSLTWPPTIQRLSVDIQDSVAWQPPSFVSDQSPEDLAYVIYTSGSTGEPKGVMIEHRAARNTILDLNQRLGTGPADRLLALSALGFDLSVYDIFGILAAGGSIILPEASREQDPAHWFELIQTTGVTLWNSVPALLGLLVEYVRQRQDCLPLGLRQVLLSGDWIPVRLPAHLKEQAPEAQVLSLGGATEASIWSISYPIGRVEPEWMSIPYGTPLGNQRWHVLNALLEPCPVWVPGELYIAGSGLARGYWQDPVRTQERFLVHPRTGERLYRTGDLGRYLPDGNLELLGRVDLQVKVQGYRIELEEIEAALLQHPDVQTAVVTAVGEAHGEKRLVACILAVAGPSRPINDELRIFLRERLPAYMVPTAFVWLDALPLTPNGKVDRRALPPSSFASAAGTPVSEEEDLPPPAVQHQLTKLVADVLKVTEIEPAANLLNVGATSIDMIRILNRVEQTLGFRPALAPWLRLPTVAALAQAYVRHQQESHSDPDADGDTDFSEPLPNALHPILDPDERAAFKRRQPALRRFAPEQGPITLPGSIAQDQLRQRYAERRTRRHFAPQALSLVALSTWLSSLRRIMVAGEDRYLYPSAGGLYPIQTYLHIKDGRVTGLVGGTYYYQPAEHHLVLLRPGGELDPGVHDPFVNGPVFAEAAFSLFLIAQMRAIAPLYGELARDFCFLEAGYMSQLLMETATAQGIGVCAIGSLDFEPIRAHFALEESHLLVHSLLGGAMTDEEGREDNETINQIDWEEGEL